VNVSGPLPQVFNAPGGLAMEQTMDRRKFLSFAAASVAVGALIALQGCNSGSSGSTTPTPAVGDKSGAISSNHGHSITLTAAQQQAGAAVTLTTTGADHTHTVGLRDTEVATIAAGTRFSVVSSVTAGHSHTITFN
jgi:hypothetical protein